MGFGIGAGRAAVSMMAGAIVTVLGDATNVTFRLSGIASRSGWPDVVVTAAVHAYGGRRLFLCRAGRGGGQRASRAKLGCSAWRRRARNQPGGHRPQLRDPDVSSIELATPRLSST